MTYNNCLYLIILLILFSIIIAIIFINCFEQKQYEKFTQKNKNIQIKSNIEKKNIIDDFIKEKIDNINIVGLLFDDDILINNYSQKFIAIFHDFLNKIYEKYSNDKLSVFGLIIIYKEIKKLNEINKELSLFLLKILKMLISIKKNYNILINGNKNIEEDVIKLLNENINNIIINYNIVFDINMYNYILLNSKSDINNFIGDMIKNDIYIEIDDDKKYYNINGIFVKNKKDNIFINSVKKYEIDLSNTDIEYIEVDYNK